MLSNEVERIVPAGLLPEHRDVLTLSVVSRQHQTLVGAPDSVAQGTGDRKRGFKISTLITMKLIILPIILKFEFKIVLGTPQIRYRKSPII